MKIVLGVDPGLASLGWGVISYDWNGGAIDIRYKAHGVINTSASLCLPQRLLEIEQKFMAILARYSPFVLGYEQQFFVKNVSSGLEVAHTLGILLLYCAKYNIQAQSFTPSTIKKRITGNARASKESVEKFMCMQLNMDIIKPHHASDALAVALVQCYALERSYLNSSIPTGLTR